MEMVVRQQGRSKSTGDQHSLKGRNTISTNVWPRFPVAEWGETEASLHRRSQIAGKIRMALSPPINHYWHAPLYVSTHGLTTSAIPYNGELFDIELGLLSQHLTITTSWCPPRTVPLRAASVAEVYADTHYMSSASALRFPQSQSRSWI